VRLAPPDPFTDGRVVLRRLRPDDAGPFTRPFAEEEGFSWLVGAEEDPTEAGVLEDIEREPSRRAAGESATFAVAEAGDDAFRGTAVLFGVTWHHARAELGIWLVPAARGRGLARGALALLCGWAHEQLGLVRLQMKTVPDNEAMLRTCERLGFEREGVLRSYDNVRGRRSDLVLLSLLPGELTRSSAPSSARRQ
jgi:RimJ/RimL family protein N-acetyltransferase